MWIIVHQLLKEEGIIIKAHFYDKLPREVLPLTDFVV